MPFAGDSASGTARAVSAGIPRTSHAGVPELGAVLLFGLKLAAYVPDLPVNRGRDLRFARLELQLLRFLHEDFLVDELTENAAREGGLPRRVGRKRHSLCPALVDRGEQLRPQHWLVTDDCNDAVDRYDAARYGGGRRIDSGWSRKRCGSGRCLRRDERGHECERKET